MDRNKALIVDKCMRRAEHEACYNAKRAIEMYAPAWEMEPSMDLFMKIAGDRFYLSREHMEICRKIMTEEGMV